MLFRLFCTFGLVIFSVNAYCLESIGDSSIKKNIEITNLQHPSDSLRCICTKSGPDAFTGDTVLQLPAQDFFIYTPPSYRKLLDGNEFLTARTALAKNGDDFVLHLYIEINSDKAGAQFGDVAARTFLTLELLKHKPVFAITHAGAKAEIRDEKTFYHAIYTMDRADTQRLKLGELDRVRLHWTKGKQVFEIYNLDVFRRQFDCWKKK